MPSLNHSSKVSGLIAKQAGELFQAQVMHIQKYTQELEHVYRRFAGHENWLRAKTSKVSPRNTVLIQNVALTRVFPTLRTSRPASAIGSIARATSMCGAS